MSRKKCHRKVWALVNPIVHAIEGAGICSDEALRDLRIRELAAIESFRTGTATVQEWSDIVALMNVCEHMANQGVGPEARVTCQEAHRHLIEAAKRFERTGRMGTSGPGLTCLRELYQWHDLQRKSVARSEYDRHIADTANRIRSKAPEVVDVLECEA